MDKIKKIIKYQVGDSDKTFDTHKEAEEDQRNRILRSNLATFFYNTLGVSGLNNAEYIAEALCNKDDADKLIAVLSGKAPVVVPKKKSAKYKISDALSVVKAHLKDLSFNLNSAGNRGGLPWVEAEDIHLKTAIRWIKFSCKDTYITEETKEVIKVAKLFKRTPYAILRRVSVKLGVLRYNRLLYGYEFNF